MYSPQDGSKQFEIPTSVLPRYYLTQYESGVKHVQMIVEAAEEKDTLVESGRTTLVCWFTNGCQVSLIIICLFAR